MIGLSNNSLGNGSAIRIKAIAKKTPMKLAIQLATSISFLRWKSFAFFMIRSPLNGEFKTSRGRKELLYNLIGMNNSDKNSIKKWDFENNIFALAYQKTKFHESTDILRETQISQMYRYQTNIAKFLVGLIFTDLLEKSVLLRLLKKIQRIVFLFRWIGAFVTKIEESPIPDRTSASRLEYSTLGTYCGARRVFRGGA